MIAAALTLLLGVLVILVIIAANGYFVAQEFAYMSVDRTILRAGLSRSHVSQDGDPHLTHIHRYETSPHP